jgi:hypothetical protein
MSERPEARNDEVTWIGRTNAAKHSLLRENREHGAPLNVGAKVSYERHAVYFPEYTDGRGKRLVDVAPSLTEARSIRAGLDDRYRRVAWIESLDVTETVLAVEMPAPTADHGRGE